MMRHTVVFNYYKLYCVFILHLLSGKQLPVLNSVTLTIIMQARIRGLWTLNYIKKQFSLYSSQYFFHRLDNSFNVLQHGVQEKNLSCCCLGTRVSYPVHSTTSKMETVRGPMLTLEDGINVVAVSTCCKNTRWYRYITAEVLKCLSYFVCMWQHMLVCGNPR